MGQRWTLDTVEKMNNFNQYAETRRLEGQSVTVEFVDQSVTTKQLNSLNLWCRMCASALEAAGIDMRALMALRSVDVPVTGDAFKETCYKPLLKALEGKDSTKEQSTSDPAEVCEVLHRYFAEKHNVQLPEWPSAR